MDVFEKLKQQGINPLDTNYVKYGSSEPLTGVEFCGNLSISRGTASSLFSFDDLAVAYASKNAANIDRPYILVEFVKSPLFLTSYTIYTLCGQPNELVVEGSKDGNKWYGVDHVITPLKDYTDQTYKCGRPGSFRFYRFTQVGVNAVNNYRLHFHKIKLFGSFNARNKCTKQSQTRKNSLPYYLIFVLTL